jgi:hypothetical protein
MAFFCLSGRMENQTVDHPNSFSHHLHYFRSSKMLRQLCSDRWHSKLAPVRSMSASKGFGSMGLPASCQVRIVPSIEICCRLARSYLYFFDRSRASPASRGTSSTRAIYGTKMVGGVTEGRHHARVPYTTCQEAVDALRAPTPLLLRTSSICRC